MGRPKLSIRPPKREREIILADIKRIERIIATCRDRPGFAQRVAEAEIRLAACKAELENARG
jgi:hypothetical protein